MVFQIIHAIGSAVYFVFFILFLCSSRVPRTNPGVGWFAAAILCAFLARVFYWALLMGETPSLGTPVYSGFVIFEKLFLVIGVSRFYGVLIKEPWLWGGAAIALFWVVFATLAQVDLQAFNIGLCAFNALFLGLVTLTIYKRDVAIPQYIRWPAIVTSGLLILHWVLYVPVYTLVYPDWRSEAFVLGTFLVLLQYLALLSAVFSLFQKRLLESERKALEIAYQDPLTGLNNKRYIDVLFEQVLLLTNRANQMLAVLYIDLDKFKPINDTSGHKVGDMVLKEIAKRLKENLRSSDICARVGGDEFVVILTQIKEENYVAEIAEKLLKQLEIPIDVDGHQYNLGASIGVSIYPQHGYDFADLMDKADQAMYKVKHDGRHGYRLYS